MINLSQKDSKHIMIAAHRGSCGGNIPCNTITAFDTALRQGADILEMDITQSADGELFVFHEGKEAAHLNNFEQRLHRMGRDDIRKLRYVNQDHDVTQFAIPSLDEVLEIYKNRCYLNLDHCWKFFSKTVDVVRRHGMEEQIILKSPAEARYYKIIEQIAPDIAYMPIFKEKDMDSVLLRNMNINYWGAEVVFSDLDSPLVSDEYITQMHLWNKKLWVNAIVYNYKVPLAGGMSDDVSLMEDPEKGWGALVNKKYDVIQTDWTGMLREYLENRLKK